MQKIFEPIFHLLYLSTVITIGFKLVLNHKTNAYFKLFGMMSLILGFGDAFHLLPRAYALITTGLEQHVKILGFGKFVTSITMTIFYLLFYKVWKLRFNKKIKWLDLTMIGLTIIRIGLCFSPQNGWLEEYPSFIWGIYRNIPFVLMGLLMIYLLTIEAKRNHDKDYIKMAKFVSLSFLFYAPVVLFAKETPLIGMLMIPKTIAYVGIILIGFKESKGSLNQMKKVA